MVDKAYGQGIKKLTILHRAGKLNIRADSLFRNPLQSAVSPEEESEIQVSSVDATTDIPTLLMVEAPDCITGQDYLGREQWKDPNLSEIIVFLEKGELPKNDSRARKLSLQESMFIVLGGILYRVDLKKRSKQVVVPQHLRRQLTEEHHRGKMAGHFSIDRVFKTMAQKW